MPPPPSDWPFRNRAQLAAGAAAIAVALGAGSVLAGGLAPVSTALTPRAVGAFLLIMAVATAAIGQVNAHPHPRPGPANWVTATRAALVAGVAGLALETPLAATAALTAFIASAAAVLDGVDGWLARRTNLSSTFGARFDMEVDALLILLLGVMVWRFEKAGAWVLLSGALRYLFVGAGLAYPPFERPLPASIRRKTVCVVQIIGLIVAAAPIVPRPLSDLSAGLTLLLLVWSFGIDVAWLWRRRSAPLPARSHG